MRPFVEKLRQRFFLGTANRDDIAIDVLCDPRLRILQIADQNRFGWTDHDARRFESDFQSMRAEVALFRRVILGIDEDRIVRTGRNACLAADADLLVEVDDAVAPAEHR